MCLPAWLAATSISSTAAKLSDVKALKHGGSIYRARLIGETHICASLGESGLFAFIDTRNGKVDIFHNELGETRLFYPTLVSSLARNALILDEASSRLHLFSKDGNSISSCGLASSILTTPYGSPVDVIPASSNFKGGFWLLTERGFILRINSNGELVSSLDLRQALNKPEGFFARLGNRADKLFAFSYNTSQLYEVTTGGSLVKTYDLLPALGGDLPPSDALLLEDGRALVSRNKRVYIIKSGKADEVNLGANFQDSPLFIDKAGERILVYNQSGELLVGTLK